MAELQLMGCVHHGALQQKQMAPAGPPSWPSASVTASWPSWQLLWRLPAPLQPPAQQLLLRQSHELVYPPEANHPCWV